MHCCRRARHSRVRNPISEHVLLHSMVLRLRSRATWAAMGHLLSLMHTGLRIPTLNEDVLPDPSVVAQKLSDRELQVLAGVCKGLQNKEIAHDFNIKEVTVKMHVRAVIRKLDAKNRTHAAMIARDLGLVG